MSRDDIMAMKADGVAGVVRKRIIYYYILMNRWKIKGLTGSICPSLFLNPFPPRPESKPLPPPLVILLCLIPDNFTDQGRAPGWESWVTVNWPICPSLFYSV